MPPFKTTPEIFYRLGYEYSAGKRFFMFFLAVLFLAVTNISCTRNQDPTIETMENYYFNNNLKNEMAVGGEYLKDSIYIQVQNRTAPFLAKGF